MTQKPPYATFLLNKLVRDFAPERFGAKGNVLHHHAITGQALETALLAKLMEEAEEVKAALKPSERTEELADLFEVMHAFSIRDAALFATLRGGLSAEDQQRFDSLYKIVQERNAQSTARA